MCRYAVEAFPSAADLLASPRLVETACLIADVHMPAMTGVELYGRHRNRACDSDDLGAAFPDDDVRPALKDGVVCHLRSRLMKHPYGVLVRLSGR